MRRAGIAGFGWIVLAVVAWTGRGVWSQEEEPQKIKKSVHPPILLKDDQGVEVLESGGLISTRQSCSSCHDYDTIANSYHAQQGRIEERKWTQRQFPYFLSRGMFGKWCSMPNRQLTDVDVKNLEDFDLGTPEWIRGCGNCHIGGGVTEFDRRNRRYDQVPADEIDDLDPDYHYYSVKRDELVRWDWKSSGIAEVDCFLCHVRNFNRPARDEQMREGYFAYALTATLLGTGIVEDQYGEYVYRPEAFNEDGTVKSEFLRLDEPGPENCGQCHGFVGMGDHKNEIQPFFSGELLRGTKKFGRIWSEGKIKDSDVNLVGKDAMDFAWDVHAEKKVLCIDCHFSPNNPGKRFARTPKAKHLKYQPGGVEWEEFVRYPDHNFAKGHSYPESICEEHECTMRVCRDCHDAEAVHDWLPYRKRHFLKVGCETCHIPQKHFWAYKQLDLAVAHTGFSEVRGIEEGQDYHAEGTKVTGFQPAYFPRTCSDMVPRITPHNLITTLFWFDGERKRPAFARQIQKAFQRYDELYRLEYTPETVAFFDADGDGALSRDELRLDTPEKTEAARQAMTQAGVHDPELRVEILPFSLSHNVVTKEQATKRCELCHSQNSILFQPVEVFDYVPAHAHMEVSPVVDVVPAFEEVFVRDGKVFYDSRAYLKNYYVLGAMRNRLVEALGWWTVLGSLLGVFMHGLFRIFPKPVHWMGKLLRRGR